MQKFELVPVFNRFTGKPDGNAIEAKTIICDFCGKEWDEDDECNSMVAFTIEEVGGAEESYYYHELSPKREDIDEHKIFTEHQEYYYCQNYSDGHDCSALMLAKFIEDGRITQPLHEIMQRSRMAVVEQKLAEGLTPEQLGIQQEG